MTLLENSHGAQASSNSSLGWRSEGMEMREQGMERVKRIPHKKRAGEKSTTKNPVVNRADFFPEVGVKSCLRYWKGCYVL